MTPPGGPPKQTPRAPDVGDRVVNSHGKTGRVVFIHGDEVIVHCETEPVGHRYRLGLVSRLVRA